MRHSELKPGVRVRVTKPWSYPKKIVVRVEAGPDLYVKVVDRWGNDGLYKIDEVEPAPPVRKKKNG